MGWMVGGGDVADDEWVDEERVLSVRPEEKSTGTLHKDGDVEQADNYRGIALGCSVVKVFVRVLARRMGRFSEDWILIEAQGGFRSGRRCSDQWLVLRGEVRKRGKKNSYLAFLNISKAYVSVWGEELGIR